MTPGCVDLKAQFGSTYRVVNEESYAADRGDSARAPDPWLQIVLCRNGHLFPHGGEWIGASTNGRGAAAKALTALPFVRVTQDGSDGLNVIFPVTEFETVAAILKPRRRRVQTPGQAERLRKFQFRPGVVVGRTHGHCEGGSSLTYHSWKSMIQRCTYSKHASYAYYGGRGIKVCDRWLNSFENFLADMGPRPTGMTLDRYPDNDGNYEPGNCRWATLKEQANNRRPRNPPAAQNAGAGQVCVPSPSPVSEAA